MLSFTSKSDRASSMLLTDVLEHLCWWQVLVIDESIPNHFNIIS